MPSIETSTTSAIIVPSLAPERRQPPQSRADEPAREQSPARELSREPAGVLALPSYRVTEALALADLLARSAAVGMVADEAAKGLHGEPPAPAPALAEEVPHPSRPTTAPDPVRTPADGEAEEPEAADHAANRPIEGLDTRFAGIAMTDKLLHSDDLAAGADRRAVTVQPNGAHAVVATAPASASPGTAVAPVVADDTGATPERLVALIAEQRRLIQRMAEVSHRLQLRHQGHADPDEAPLDALTQTRPLPSPFPLEDAAAGAADFAVPAVQMPAPVPVRRDAPDPAALGLAQAIAATQTISIAFSSHVQATALPPPAEAPPVAGKATIAVPHAPVASPVEEAPSPLPAWAAGIALSVLAGVALYAALAVA